MRGPGQAFISLDNGHYGSCSLFPVFRFLRSQADHSARICLTLITIAPSPSPTPQTIISICKSVKPHILIGLGLISTQEISKSCEQASPSRSTIHAVRTSSWVCISLRFHSFCSTVLVSVAIPRLTWSIAGVSTSRDDICVSNRAQMSFFSAAQNAP